MKQDEIENKKKAFLGEKIIYDNLGQYIWAVQKNGHHQKLADLRGWGAIQNLFTDIKDAEKFQDEIGELIAKTLHDHLLSKKPSVSDCMKVQIVGSLLDLLTPTKEERKDDYNKAQDRGASTNSFK